MSRKYRVTESQLLNELEIPDWRHMSKDKVITFMNSLPDMDPEVAKAAIAQFPEFTKLAGDMVATMKESLNSILDEGGKSADREYEINSRILDSLDRELTRGNLSSEERTEIIDNMMRVSENIAKAEHDHKAFLLQAFGIVVGGIAILAGGAVALLGGKSDIES